MSQKIARVNSSNQGEESDATLEEEDRFLDSKLSPREVITDAIKSEFDVASGHLASATESH